MRSNTSRVTTRFSDFDHLDGVPMFPTNQQVLDYLRNYAAQFKLDSHLRLNTSVTEIARAGGKWIVTSAQRGETDISELFSRVIIASGRYNKPHVPNIKGIERFKGTGGVTHTFHYRGNKFFAGKRVLVVGNSISGLEVCSDLAFDPGIRVISSCRKPRYIFNKTLAGRPTDCVAFNRFASLAFRALPLPQAAAGLKQILLQHCGNPAQYGGLKPADNIFEAGITQCQYYLPLVAEGKIIVKGAVAEFTEDAVIFEDGAREPLDAAILATGYDLNLPFLTADLRRRLDVDDTHLDLYQHTFHPELPDLAFIGLYSQIGPYFPTVELQARWVTNTFSGRQPLPARDTMLAGIAAHREWNRHFKEVMVHDMVLLFAQAAGVAPDLVKRPELAKALLFGPLSPVQFRMDGHGELHDAAARFAEAVAEFGCVTNLQFDTHELKGLQMLAANLKEEKWLAELLQKLQQSAVV
jgi:dimethylaniline monooxygenase (N-oxide forming)